MTYPFGVDLSKWQSKPESGLYMDMSKLLGHDDPVCFVFIRASHGMYKDTVHAFYADELDRLNIPNGSYHYASPAYSARLQVDHFLSIAPPKEGRRWTLDLEAHQGLSKARITDWTLEFIELMKERTGRYPMIYSRTSWINPYLDVGRLPKLDYWLAQYRSPVYPFTPEFPSDKIDIPKGIDRRWIKFHQTGDKADGKKYGTVSNHIDTDRFLGTHEELMAWFGREEPEEPAEPPSDPVEPPVSKPLYCARVITDPGWRLNVRETAGGRVVGSLDSGDLVNVWEETGDWARIGDSRWVSMHWIARVENSPEEPEGEVRFEAIVVTTYDWLPVREKPGYFEKEVRRLYKGDRIKVYEANKDRWYRIGNNEWCYGARCRSLTEPVSTLLYPMASKFPISQRFGVNSATYAVSKGHNGVDWASWRGTKLIAAADGYVETVELYTTYGYGRHCRIRIQGGVLIYGHMLEVFVEEGQRVKAGDVIGLSDGEKGNKYAGFSTGAHLHFEYRIDREPSPLKAGNHTYWAVDPLPLITK